MDFQHLWEKFKSGQASQAEMKELASFLEKQEGIRALEAAVEEQWEKIPKDVKVPVHTTERDSIYRGIAKQKGRQFGLRKLSGRRNLWLSAAAAVVLLIVSTLIYSIYQTSTEPIWVTVRTTQNTQQVKLPDGSVAWMNRNSVLSYQNPFSDSLRLLELEGEGYFEVVSDKRPFIVESEGIQTKVLGTIFNVNAYPNNDAVQVALLEGRVVVNTPTMAKVDLDPGELVRVDKRDMSLEKQDYEGDQHHVWLKGLIHFDGAKVGEVMRTLKNWYDVQFEIENEHLSESELVYRFDTNRFTLDEVVQHINTVSDYTITKSANNLYIVKHK
ncbi:MAG: FecR domain-containing protein [Saprospiraceae bacterium]|nr:FecR domain-containing protein [Saprospiraceae bacterium]